MIDPNTLSPEDYERAMEDLFASTGWKLFLHEIWALSENINDIQNMTPDTLLFEQGRVSLCGFVLNYEEIMEKTDLESS